MTDHHTSDPSDLEVASAYLDGEATDQEVARVSADRRLLALVAELAEVRNRLAVPAPPGVSADDHVAVALAAFDQDAEVPAGVTSLAERRRWRGRIPLGAVAAALVLIALVGALTQLDLGRQDDLATASGDSQFETTGSALDRDTALAPADDGADAAPELGYTGPQGRLAFSTTDDLAEYLSQHDAQPAPTDADSGAGASVAGGSTSSDTESRSFDPCDAARVAGADPAAVQELMGFVVSGRDVTAVVAASSEPGVRRLVVVDDASCEIVADRTI